MALGTIDPEFLDHMFREHCYYLSKIRTNIPREWAVQGLQGFDAGRLDLLISFTLKEITSTANRCWTTILAGSSQ